MQQWKAWIEGGGSFANGKPAALHAWNPAEVASGHIFLNDAPLLKLLEKLTSTATGAVIGHVGYGGDYLFAWYPKTEWTNADSWSEKDAFHAGPLLSSLDAAAFCERVETIRDFIRAGDIYQANLTRMLRGSFSGSSMALFTALKAVSPAPFSAYLETPEIAIVSSSPELFLRMDGRAVVTRPIKGTRPRFADAEQDRISAQELVESEKEKAELIMITDLERNDLGKVCEFGSIRVTELAGRHSFAQVHHLVSTVEGRLRDGVSHLDALRACFPGGSITGAPKKRAMEIIAELEPHRRGIYTGAIGYFGAWGESQFNIAIRTMSIGGGEVSFGVGGGITIESDPAKEFEETEHKAAGMVASLSMG